MKSQIWWFGKWSAENLFKILQKDDLKQTEFCPKNMNFSQKQNQFVPGSFQSPAVRRSKVKVNSQPTSDRTQTSLWPWAGASWRNSEVRRRESFSSSLRDSELLMSDNLEPLSAEQAAACSLSASVWLILVKLRHVLLKMTLFKCKRVLKAARSFKGRSLYSKVISYFNSNFNTLWAWL